MVQLVTEPLWSREASIAAVILVKNRNFDQLWNWHKRWSNSSLSHSGAERRASRLSFWWKIAILINFEIGTKSGPTRHWATVEQRGEHRGCRFGEKSQFWSTLKLAQKVVQLVTEPLWRREASVAAVVLVKNRNFDQLWNWHKKWSNSSLSHCGGERRASRLSFWWKIAILINFEIGTKSGPTRHWATVEERGERRGCRFGEKSQFWSTLKLAQKVVQLVTEPLWRREASVAAVILVKNRNFDQLWNWQKMWSNSSLSHCGGERRASRLSFWWKIAILINFEIGTKSGPTRHWATVEERGERRGCCFGEKSQFWSTLKLAQKVVQLVTEPLWRREASVAAVVLVKNCNFDQHWNWHKKWSNSSLSHCGAERRASRLSFWWKIAILINFEIGTKSGPTRHWATVEERGERRDCRFGEKLQFWSTLKLAQKVVQLVTEPLWRREASVAAVVLVKNCNFDQLWNWHKKWYNSSLSHCGGERRALRLSFWWKIAILIKFEIGTKSGPTRHWATVEQRGERRGCRFGEKSQFWSTLKLAQKVVQLVTEPLWSREASVAAVVLVKNGNFDQLWNWHKKWSNSSLSHCGGERRASRLSFWWKIAILINFEIGTKSGPTRHWATLEQRGERRGCRFGEKLQFWSTLKLAQKVVQLVTEPLWRREASVAAVVLVKNHNFDQLWNWHKKWSNSSLSHCGAERRASRLSFWWKIAILINFEIGTKSGPTRHWATVEERGERRGCRFGEKSQFWSNLKLAQKVVQLVTEPLWSREASVAAVVLVKNRNFDQIWNWHKKWSNSSLSHCGGERRASRLSFWWKIAILINFEIGTKSGPTRHWATVEERGERLGCRFGEKSQFWSTLKLAQKVVQLVTEPLWSREASVAAVVLVKNGNFDQLWNWHKKWSNSSLSHCGGERRASRLSFWWKIAILINFEIGTKSGPTRHWATLEQRGERRGCRFGEKLQFWSTLKLAQKVVQLVTEPLWRREASVAAVVLVKNRNFDQLWNWHKKWSNSSLSHCGAERRASRLSFWWKIAILINFEIGTKSGPTRHWATVEERGERRGCRFGEKSQFWSNLKLAQKVVQLVTEPLWRREASVAAVVLVKNRNFDQLWNWHKKWSNSSLSHCGGERRASRLSFWWKIAILINFEIGTKSGPTRHWATVEERGEHRGCRFGEKSQFWSNLKLAQKVVQLVTEPLWRREASVAAVVLVKNRNFDQLWNWHKKWSNSSLSHCGGERRASRLSFWWKIAILIKFEIGTKSGPTRHWATVEERGERRGCRFGEKSQFWSTLKLAQKVVQLVTEPLWRREASVAAVVLVKNRNFDQLWNWHKKWSNSSLSHCGGERRASRLSFWWKIAILINFEIGTKSGPTRHWATVEERGERRGCCFGEKSQFWSTLKLAQKVVQLVTEPLWRREASVAAVVLVKNRNFDQLWNWHKKWSNSSLSHCGGERRASRLSFWWKIAILINFEIGTKSGPTRHWATVEERGERRGCRFGEKSQFWSTLKLAQKVVQLVTEPLWRREASVAAVVLVKNRNFDQLWNWHKKWSNSSLSHCGGERRASRLSFWWKIAILINFEIGTKSGPTRHWATVEERGERRGCRFGEKSQFWSTLKLAQKVVQLVTEPLWRRETSVAAVVLVKNRNFDQLWNWHKKWSNSSLSHCGGERRASRLSFWWKIAILINFEIGTKSGPTRHWATVEERGERRGCRFGEKSQFWSTLKLAQKVVQLVTEPLWRREVSVAAVVLVKNHNFDQLWNWHKKWSNSSLSHCGGERRASRLSFWWKIAILINFEIGTKSGPTRHWATVEERGERRGCRFGEKSQFWSTLKLAQKVVQLVTEPLWRREASVAAVVLVKNHNFDQLWNWHKKWSNSSLSHCGGERRASRLSFWWKIAILINFEIGTKSGPTRHWATVEERGERRGCRFGEKSQFWSTLKLAQKVVQLVTEPLWRREASVAAVVLVKNRNFDQLWNWHKKWSNSSLSHCGGERRASRQSFWWKIAILIKFEIGTKSGPTRHWATVEERGEHRGCRFGEKSQFWSTLKLAQKVVQLVTEPLWSREASVAAVVLVKNRNFDQLWNWHKKWSNSSLSHCGGERRASRLWHKKWFWWKIAILINFEIGTKSGPTRHWATVEERGERRGCRFGEKSQFWSTLKLAQKVVQLVTEPLWRREASGRGCRFGEKSQFWSTLKLAQKVVQLVTEPLWRREASVEKSAVAQKVVLVKNRFGEKLQFWSTLKLAQKVVQLVTEPLWRREASVAAVKFVGTKSGPTRHWATVEERGERRGCRFGEKSQFWSTLKLAQKVVQLVTEPLWRREASVAAVVLVKNRNFDQLKLAQKVVQLVTATVEERGERRGCRFGEKSQFWSTLKLAQKVVQLVTEPLWRREASVAAVVLVKNRDQLWNWHKKWSSLSHCGGERRASRLSFWWKIAILLWNWHKKWSNSSLSHCGGERRASRLSFWWKIAILINFEIGTKSGPTRHWATVEERGERRGCCFGEKSQFWSTLKLAQKVVQLVTEPLWRREASVAAVFWWKIAILINFEIGTKSGPTRHWATVEERGECRGCRFGEKSQFWSTLKLAQKVSNSSLSHCGGERRASWLSFWCNFDQLWNWHKKWSNSSLSHCGGERRASRLSFWWKNRNFDHRGCHFDEKSQFWSTLKLAQKVVQLVTEPLWSREASIAAVILVKNRNFDQLWNWHKKWSNSSLSHCGGEASVAAVVLVKNRNFDQLWNWHKKWSNSSLSHCGGERRASRLLFWWKIAILINFEIGTKSGQTCHWATVEERGERRSCRFGEKLQFWSTLKLAQKVVQLVTEPLWRREASVAAVVLVKNRNFDQIWNWHKKWSNSSLSHCGGERRASRLSFWWKIAILINFEIGTKSGPTRHWATVEERGERRGCLLVKNHNFDQLWNWHKKWSNSSLSHCGGERRASRLSFWWKIAILINFEIGTKSGPTRHWATVEQRGERRGCRFGEKSQFWSTLKLAQKVVQLVTEPLWRREASVAAVVLVKNHNFDQLWNWHKKWSNSSLSHCGGERRASRLSFWWKITILINFEIGTKSGPTRHWATVEERGERRGCRFGEKSQFWSTLKLAQKVVQLVTEPLWRREASVAAVVLVKNPNFDQLWNWHKKWSNSSLSHCGGERWASRLLFWWKIAILINFEIGTKSGPTRHWATVEERGERRDSRFGEQFQSWSKLRFFTKTTAATLASLLHSGSVTSWTTFCANFKVDQNCDFSPKRQPRRSPLSSTVAQWRVGPLFVPISKLIKIAIFHQNDSRDARLSPPQWLSDELDHFLCQFQSWSKLRFFTKTTAATLASLLHSGSVTSWTTFCANFKVDQNCDFSPKRQPRCSPLSSTVAQWRVGPLFVPISNLIKIAIFHQNDCRDARLSPPQWLSDELDHFLCQFQSWSKLRFFTKTTAATLASLLHSGSVTSWTTFCANFKVDQNCDFSPKRQPRRSPLSSTVAQWRVGPLFVPISKLIKIAIFHQNDSRDARLSPPQWLSDELDHFLCQFQSWSKLWFFTKTTAATLASLLHSGSVTSWTTFCANFKVDQNCDFSPKRQPRRSPLSSTVAQWRVGPLFVPISKLIKIAIFHQNDSRDARLSPPQWLSDELDHFLCQFQSWSKLWFFTKTTAATLTSLLHSGSVTSWTTFCANFKVDQNCDFSPKRQPRRSPLSSTVAQWRVGPLFVPISKLIKIAIFHQNDSRDARLSPPQWLSDELDHFLCQFQSWSKLRFFTKTTAATLVSLLHSGSVTSWTTFCANFKVDQNCDFSPKRQPRRSPLSSTVAQWRVGPLFVPISKLIKIAIFHQNDSRDARLSPPQWLSDELDHFLCQFQSWSKLRFFTKTTAATLASLLHSGSVTSWTTFCANFKVDQNCDFSPKRQPRRSPLSSTVAQWRVGPLFVPISKLIKIAIFHQNDSRDARLSPPQWLSDELDHFLCQFQSWSKLRFFTKTTAATLASLLHSGSVTSWTTFCANFKVDQNCDFSPKQQPRRSPLSSTVAQWRVGPLFVPISKLIKIAIFHQNDSRDARLSPPQWLSDELDHFLCQFQSWSKLRFFTKTTAATLASLLHSGSVTSWTTFCANFKVDQNCDFSPKRQPRRSPLSSTVAQWRVGPLFVPISNLIKIAIFHQNDSRDARLSPPQWLSDELDHFLCQFQSWSKLRFFTKTTAATLASLLHSGSVTSWTTFCANFKFDQNCDFSPKRQPRCSPLSSTVAQWRVGPLFVPISKLIKIAIFHQNDSRDARLSPPQWLSDELDHFLCQFQSWSKLRFFTKTTAATLASLLHSGSVTSWTTFCANFKFDQNCDFSPKRQPRRSPLSSTVAQWRVGPLFVPISKLIKIAIFHQNDSRDARLSAPQWLSDELDHFLCQFQSWSKLRFFTKTTAATLASLLHSGSVTSWTTFCANFKVDQNCNFSPKRQPRRSPLCSRVAQWRVGPLFVPISKLIKIAIFHQNDSRDARLSPPQWLSDELDHFLCQFQSWSKLPFFTKTTAATLASLLHSGSVTSWTTFCANFKVDQNCDFSPKRQPRRSPLSSTVAQWRVGPLFVPISKLIKIAIFHQNDSRDARLSPPQWLSDELDHFLCQFQIWSKLRFFTKTTAATLASLLHSGSVTSWTTFCANFKFDQNCDFSPKRQPRRSPLSSTVAQWRVGPLFVPISKLIKIAIFHQNDSRDARLSAPQWLSDELDHFLCQFQSWSKLWFFTKTTAATLASLLHSGSVTSWTTFCANFKVDQNCNFSPKRQPRRSPLCSRVAQWRVGPLFVPISKLIKIAIFHQNDSRDARLSPPQWLSDELDHFLCQFQSWSKLPFFTKTTAATLASLLHSGSVTSWTTFCANFKVDQNCDFSPKRQPRRSPLCSTVAQWRVGPLFVPISNLIKIAIFHQNDSRNARLSPPQWLSDELYHFLCQFQSWSKLQFFTKTTAATLASLLHSGSVTSWTTFCANFKVDQNCNFSPKRQSRRSPLSSTVAQWRVGPLFVPISKLIKIAIFHQNDSRDARLSAPQWLSDELDHFLCQFQCWSKLQFFTKTTAATLASLLHSGSVTSWTTFCANFKVDQNCDFSPKQQPRRSPLSSTVAQWRVGPLFVPISKLIKIAIFHQNDSRDARLSPPQWLSDELDHIFCQFQSWSKLRFFTKMTAATLASLLHSGSVTSWTTFCANFKVDQNCDFSPKRQPRRSPLSSTVAQWRVGPLFVPISKLIKIAIFHQNDSRDARLSPPQWLSDELDHFLCQFQSWSKLRFFTKTTAATLASLLHSGSVTSWTTFCANFKVDQNCDFSPKRQPRCSPLCSTVAQWRVGPLFVPISKLIKIAIFHQNDSRDARLSAPEWLSDELDHLLCQFQSWSKLRFFTKMTAAMLASLLHSGSVTSWTTFCANFKVDQNCDFSPKWQPRRSPLCS